MTRESNGSGQRRLAEPAEAEWERLHAEPSGKTEPSGKNGGAVGQPAWSGDAARGKLSRRLSAKSPANTPGRAIRLKGRAVKGTAVKGRAVKGGAVKGGVARSSVVTSPAGPWHVRRGAWQAAIAVIAILGLVAVGFLAFGGSGGASARPARPAAVAQYPPARLAGADFGTDPGHQARGIFQSVSAVAAAGETIVAVGSLTGQWIPRAQFLVSADGGHSWRLAPVRAPGGSAPSPADLPLLVAGGAALPGGGGWLALGDGAAWTSQDGETWTLAPGTGIAPLHAGDRVLALARTGRGFLAVGEHVPGGAQAKATPVAWTSADGLRWRRLPASSLHLATRARGRVLRLSRVAAHGGDVVVEGEIATAHGRGKHRTVSLSDAVWRSGNGGRRWRAVHLPVGRGATSRIAGLAVAGQRFLVIRPGRTRKTGRDAVAYVSRGGAYWNRIARIAAAKQDHLKITAVGGSDQGAVVSGRLAGGATAAWVSATGRSWRRVASLGSSAQTLAGLTVTTGETVVAAGATAYAADGQQPYLVLSGRQASAVNFAAIAGAAGPALRVSGIAVAGRTRVAVGSANGVPGHLVGRRPRAAGGGSAPPPSPAPASAPWPAWCTAGRDGSRSARSPPARPAIPSSSPRPGRPGWQAADGESAFGGAGITAQPGGGGPVRVRHRGQAAHPRADGHEDHDRAPAQACDQARPPVPESSRRPGGRRAWPAGPGEPPPAPATWTARVPGRWTPSPPPGPGTWRSARSGTRPRSGPLPTAGSGLLTALPPLAGASAGVLEQVAARGRVIVATGNETTAAGTAAFAAYSTDGGGSWQQTPLSAPGGLAAVTALTAAGRGFEAAGTVGRPGNQRVIVWSSRDGIGWHAREPAGIGLSDWGAQAITALTSSGSLVTGVGYVATPAAEQPTLWRAAAASG